jgi:hypothetical protein
MKIFNKIKGNLFSRKKRINSISKLKFNIGKEISFPYHYFCVVTNGKDNQTLKLSLKSSTINDLLNESEKKKAVIYIPYYLNLKKNENFKSFKDEITNIKIKDEVEDFFIVSYFPHSDINLFYTNMAPIMSNCNFSFVINEFDSYKIQKFFKNKFAVIILDEKNKIISTTYTSKLRIAMGIIMWSFLIYMNLIYIPEVENFIKI